MSASIGMLYVIASVIGTSARSLEAAMIGYATIHRTGS